jgi:hypothetical protein
MDHSSEAFILTLTNRTWYLRDISMVPKPKPHDDVELTSLEPVLALQNIIHHLAVLTCISAVNQVYEATESGQAGGTNVVRLTVTAHYTRNARHNAPHERMSVNLVLCSVVNVR